MHWKRSICRTSRQKTICNGGEQYIQTIKTSSVNSLKMFSFLLFLVFIIKLFSMLTSFLHGNHCLWKIHLTFTFHYVPSHYAILSCNNFITLPLPTNIPFYITSAQLHSNTKFQSFSGFSVEHLQMTKNHGCFDELMI